MAVYNCPMWVLIPCHTQTFDPGAQTEWITVTGTYQINPLMKIKIFRLSVLVKTTDMGHIDRFVTMHYFTGRHSVFISISTWHASHGSGMLFLKSSKCPVTLKKQLGLCNVTKYQGDERAPKCPWSQSVGYTGTSLIHGSSSASFLLPEVLHPYTAGSGLFEQHREWGLREAGFNTEADQCTQFIRVMLHECV